MMTSSRELFMEFKVMLNTKTFAGSRVINTKDNIRRAYNYKLSGSIKSTYVHVFEKLHIVNVRIRSSFQTGDIGDTLQLFVLSSQIIRDIRFVRINCYRSYLT